MKPDAPSERREPRPLLSLYLFLWAGLAFAGFVRARIEEQRTRIDTRGLGSYALRAEAPRIVLFSALAAGVLIVALLFLRGWRRGASSLCVAPFGRSTKSRVIGASAVLLVIASWVAPSAAVHWDPPRRAVRFVVLDFLEAAELRTVEERHPRFEPRVQTLTPASNATSAGSDMPALAMPPPCTISFEIPAIAGRLRLDPTAGVDGALLGQMGTRTEVCRVGFEVQVNGELRGRSEVVVREDQSVDERVWTRPAGAAGLVLRAGDRVTLRTRLLEPTDRKLVRTLRVPAGFANLCLARDDQVVLADPAAGHPNIVFIVMDTLRRDRVSCYGATSVATPNLQALADRGAVYDNAYSAASWTWPATASMLTGLWPQTHGVVGGDSTYLPESVDALPEALERAGYRTGAFSGNPLINHDKNFDQGFDVLDEDQSFRKSDQLLSKVDEWLDRWTGQRFFLYLHLVDPHSPCEPSPSVAERRPDDPPQGYPGPNAMADFHRALLDSTTVMPDGSPDVDHIVPKEFRDWAVERYDASVETCDEYIGRLLATLAERRLLDDTLVVFTSDHGEELFQRGFAAHAHSIYDELVHVPLIMAGPGIRPGTRVAAHVSTRSLAPSLARRGGAELRGLEPELDLLDVERLVSQPVFFSTQNGWWRGNDHVPMYGVQIEDWVLHYIPARGAEGVKSAIVQPVARLFDLATDPEQRVDVAERNPERVERMQNLLLEHLKLAAERGTGVKVGAGRITLRVLQEIGYVGDD